MTMTDPGCSCFLYGLFTKKLYLFFFLCERYGVEKSSENLNRKIGGRLNYFCPLSELG